ncbi:MAG TPA: efflux RND transporter periplasmic adaptor subunit [Bryobacteraceae bacterium]|nr:efflux RND transporter periplasmic adaptor subunit [Bryobacteraceae bacterium]
MNLRLKVYGSVALLVLGGAGWYLFKTKPSLFPGVAQASAKSGPNDKDSKKEKEKEAVPVELAAAQKSAISSFVSATANLRALREVAVSSELDGVVAKIHAEEGDFAQSGQLLATLDDRQLKIQLRLAEEKFEQAKLQMEKAGIRQEKAAAQIGHARIERDRYEKAAKEGLVSDKEVAAYKYKLEELVHDEKVSSSEIRELEHRVSELQAEIANTRLQIERTQIRAPFAGHITQRTAVPGQRVRASDALFHLGAFSPLYADVFLSEKDAGLVRSKQAATIRLGSDTDVKIDGHVERISPVVDQATGTVKVTVELQPKASFRPGSFVRVDIRTDTKSDATLIPKRALIEEDGQFFVFVASNDTAKRAKVQVGYQSEGMVEVLNGVQPGQNVVVAGQGALKEGQKIRVIRA